jgi:hypothetical protein
MAAATARSAEPGTIAPVDGSTGVSSDVTGRR